MKTTSVFENKPINPYLDSNYEDRTDEIEALFEPTVNDIKKDPEYYAELVNDLLYHWICGIRETPLMWHARKGREAYIKSYLKKSK